MDASREELADDPIMHLLERMDLLRKVARALYRAHAENARKVWGPALREIVGSVRHGDPYNIEGYTKLIVAAIITIVMLRISMKVFSTIGNLFMGILTLCAKVAIGAALFLLILHLQE